MSRCAPLWRSRLPRSLAANTNSPGPYPPRPNPHSGPSQVRLGIRFVREDEGFDRNWWRAGDVVQPIVAALDPNGAAAAAGLEVDDMVLSINGHTGLSNTQAAAQLRELTGAISIVVRKSAWVGGAPAGPGGETPRAPETPRSAMRRLV